MPGKLLKSLFSFLFLSLLQPIYSMENNDKSIYSRMFDIVHNDPLYFPVCRAMELGEKNRFCICVEGCEIIKNYIIQEANPHRKTGENEKTPLNLAGRKQKKDLFDFLLQNKNHIACFISAFRKNNPIEAIKELCKLEASLTKNDKNENIFHFIIDRRYPHAIGHYIEPLITDARLDDFDNFNKGSKKTVLFALWFFEQLKLNNNIFIPNDIKFRILSNLPLSDLYPYKKLCRKLLENNYHHILLPVVHERVENIKQTLASPNNENKTALQLMLEKFANNQDIKKFTPLFSGELLQNNYNDFIEDFPAIVNSELEKDKKNLARQIFDNCAKLFLEGQ